VSVGLTESNKTDDRYKKIVLTHLNYLKNGHTVVALCKGLPKSKLGCVLKRNGINKVIKNKIKKKQYGMTYTHFGA
jgi:hypothetical protein